MPRSPRNGALSRRGWSAATNGRRLVATLAVAAFAHAASAALFDDDEARKRIAETNQRLAQVQKQLEDRIAAIENRTAGIVEVSREMADLVLRSAGPISPAYLEDAKDLGLEIAETLAFSHRRRLRRADHAGRHRCRE